MKTLENNKFFLKDWPFWFAMSLAPACWLVLYLLGIPLRSGVTVWSTLLMAVAVYPVLEEYVFRGGIQGSLYERIKLSYSIAGISIANVLTSALFAAAHLINQPPLWATLVLFPSLIFGWMRDRYGHIYASVALHVFYNAGFFWFFSAG